MVKSHINNSSTQQSLLLYLETANKSSVPVFKLFYRSLFSEQYKRNLRDKIFFLLNILVRSSAVRFEFCYPNCQSFHFFNESLQTLLSKDYEKMKIIAYLSKNQNSKVNCSITKLSCQKQFSYLAYKAVSFKFNKKEFRILILSFFEGHL